MPGIVGIVSPKGKDNIADCLGAMITPMRRHEWYQVQKVVEPPTGLASISLDDSHQLSTRNSIHLAFAGEIVEQDKLRSQLQKFGDPQAYEYRFSDVLLALYLSFGTRGLCGLNGLYVITIWEEELNKLTVINDRYGMGKLYYWNSPDRLMFASEYKSISWHPGFSRNIDELGLSDLLFSTDGGMYDDRTLFENIKTFPPACIAVHHNGKLTFEKYWDPQFFHPENGVMTEGEYIDVLALKTRDAVRSRAREKTCLLLSGGLDSRTIAGMFDQIGGEYNLVTNTIGLENCWDVKFGKKIAQSIGCNHIFIPIRPTYLKDYSDDCVWRTEGNLNCHGSWIFAEDELVEKRTINYTIVGLNGDGIFGRHWKNPSLLEEMNLEQALQYISDQGVKRINLMEKLLKPDIMRNIADGSFQSLKRSFEQADTENNLNRYDNVYLRQFIRRPNAVGMDILGEYTNVLAPLYDNDLVDFCLAIPPQLRAHGYIHKKMIIEHLPKVARINYQSLFLNVNSTFSVENNKFLSTINRVQKGFRRRLPIANRNISGDYPRSCFYYNTWIRTASRNFVLGVFDQKEYLEDYFNIDAVDDLVNDHMEGKRHEFRMICALITFSLWRQRFWGV